MAGCSNMGGYEPYEGEPAPPVFTASFTVDDNSTVVRTARVVLTIEATLTEEMRFRNSGGAWSLWEPFAPARVWDLPQGHGVRMVEAEFRDADGNSITDNDEVVLTERLIASDGATEDFFGYDVAIADDGMTVVVGMPGDNGNDSGFFDDEGAVYVYEWSGSTWDETRLTGPSCLAGDGLGTSVAINAVGDVIAAGAPGHEVTHPGQGAVYIFSKNAGVWSYDAVYWVAGDPGDAFGHTCALSSDGSLLAVCAPDQNSQQGAVYIFHENAGTYVLRDTLDASDGESGDCFGFDVSLSDDGNDLVVGAPMESEVFLPHKGSAYIYSYGGGVWSETILASVDAIGDDYFGYSVEISGDGMVTLIGARGHEVDGIHRHGAAWVFRENGGAWDRFELPVADGTASEYIGTSGAISEDGATVIVGANQDDLTYADQGSIRLFRWQAGSTEYLLEDTIALYDGSFEDRLGCALALTPDGTVCAAGVAERNVTGTDDGAVFFFRP